MNKVLHKIGFFFWVGVCYTFLTGASYAVEMEKEYDFEISSMYSYQELLKDIDKLQNKYSDILRTETLTETYDGRNVIALSIGNKEADKKLLIFGAIHAREYITSQLVMRQLYDVLEKIEVNQEYNGISVSKLLDNEEVYFIPMLNPDGVSLCQYGIDGANKKSTRQMIYRIYEMDHAVELSDYLNQWKANAKGVDLNRNFNADWEEYDDGIYHPSSDHFKGVKYESEAESKAIADLTREKRFDRTISYHTQGEVIYWFYKQDGNLYRITKNFADIASKETGYLLDANYQALDSGGYKDWAILHMEIPSLTIEVGSGKSPVDPKQIETIWEENKNICLSTIYDLYME